MVEFWVYDVIFLVLFSLWVAWFLYTRKKNLGREGIIFMYRTQLGIKAINWVGDNFKKTLHFFKYIIITVGLFLMGTMLWMLGQTVYIYLSRPEITDVIKAPPIAPLIPYFPKLFGMESFFPPFYFTYFIIALAIVAIVHEFNHGIFMRLFKVKIKSTGVVFLGPLLGAFVEEERKGFEKKRNLEQMTILGAGVFANAVFALLFYIIYVGFFFMAFSPAGYVFNSYSIQVVPTDSLDDFGIDVGTKTVLIGGQIAEINLSEVTLDNRTFFISTEVKNTLLESNNLSGSSAILIDKAPAVENGMLGAIVQADDVKINNNADLKNFLQNTKPGDSVRFLTETEEGIQEYNVELTEHPNSSIEYGYLGVGHSAASPRGVIQNLFAKFMFFKDSSTFYKPSFDGEFTYFILHLFWWIMVINILVALFNMLPLGILDGGRFFYLAVLSITGSKKFANSLFKFMTYLILSAFLLLMLVWFFRVF